MRRIIVVALAAFSLISLGFLASPASADTAAQVAARCGSGYSLVASVISDPNGHFRLYLFFNNSNGYNCAITDIGDNYENQHLGSGQGWITGVNLKVKAANGTVTSKTDEGYFDSYAGPVKIYGNNLCVKVEGWQYTYQDTDHFPWDLPTYDKQLPSGGGWGYCG